MVQPEDYKGLLKIRNRAKNTIRDPVLDLGDEGATTSTLASALSASLS